MTMATTKKAAKKKAVIHPQKDRMVFVFALIFTVLSLIFAGMACLYYVYM